MPYAIAKALSGHFGAYLVRSLALIRNLGGHPRFNATNQCFWASPKSVVSNYLFFLKKWFSGIFCGNERYLNGKAGNKCAIIYTKNSITNCSSPSLFNISALGKNSSIRSAIVTFEQFRPKISTKIGLRKSKYCGL
jgi:hypothetical protein